MDGRGIKPQDGHFLLPVGVSEPGTSRCSSPNPDPAAPAWPSGLARGFRCDARKSPGSFPGDAISVRTAASGLGLAAGSRLRLTHVCRSRRFLDNPLKPTTPFFMARPWDHENRRVASRITSRDGHLWPFLVPQNRRVLWGFAFRSGVFSSFFNMDTLILVAK